MHEAVEASASPTPPRRGRSSSVSLRMDSVCTSVSPLFPSFARCRAITTARSGSLSAAPGAMAVRRWHFGKAGGLHW